MATPKDDSHYHKILTFYNIVPTPIKVEVLKGIYACNATFNLRHLHEAMEQNGTYINQTSLPVVIRCYIRARLLVKVNQMYADNSSKKSSQRYALSGDHILLFE